MLKNIALLSLVFAKTMSMELTPDTWDNAVAGKSVFLKFFAPWCGHCKAMKPAWDSLMEEFGDSDTVLVADVDCIGDGKPLCDKMGVEGFPTIKFGDPSNLDAYKGGRDLVTLQAFASELTPSCKVDTLEYCDKTEKETVAKLFEEDEESLSNKIMTHDKGIESIESSFKIEVGKLQEKYQSLTKKKTTDLDDFTKKSDIGLIRAVSIHRKDKKEEQTTEL
tara:strand:+ start:1416 stop:2078 length:663 start_codon:yes stop_codon:yes gene_type:complete